MGQITPTYPTVGGSSDQWATILNSLLASIVAQGNSSDAAVASLPETIRDTIGAALKQGTGIGIAVDDAGDTITITNTGSGTGTGSGSSTGSSGIAATVDGASVQALSFRTGVTAADVGALPTPAGTPTAGQVPIVTATSPLALGWGTASTSGGSTSTSSSTTALRPETWGAKADGVILTDLVINQGSATITSATAPFTSTAVDKGKLLAWRSSTWGYSYATIDSVQSSTQATLTANAPAGVQTDGGPNPNAVFGTDNTAAFNSCYAAAQSVPLYSANQYRPPVSPGRQVRLEAGVYLVKPLNVMTAWNVITVGQGRTETVIACVEPTSTFQLATFNTNASYAFPSTVLNWSWQDIHFMNPVGMNGAFNNKIGCAIQDNGNGSVRVDRCLFSGFKYGYASPYGGDFTRFTDVYFENCDVGLYLGPGAQQVEIGNMDTSNCAEGAVFEGVQNWHIGSNSHFQDPRISAITIEGKASGQKTRWGVASDIGGGAWYSGTMVIDGSTWFETNSGNNGYVCPRMIWVNGDGPYGPAFSGLVVRDALLIAGGTQVANATNCFIELNTGQIADEPVYISGLSIGGTFINYIFNSSGISGTKPRLERLQYDTSKIQMVRNTTAHKYVLQNGQYHGFTAV